MRFAALLFSLALIFVSALADLTGRIDDFRHVDIYAWPLSAAKPQKFARLMYNYKTAHIQEYTPPKISADEDIVRVGFYGQSGAWTGIATAAENFKDDGDCKSKQGGATVEKKLLLLLDTRAEIYHIGFAVANLDEPVTPADPKSSQDGLSVEVRELQQGAVPILNKPVVVNEAGQVEGQKQEKSFIQKYWWAFALFMLAQLVMGGQKEEEGAKK